MKPLTAKLSQEVNTDQPSIQKEYWDTGLGAAGCIFVARDTGKILLAHRNPNKDPERGRVEESNTWATWGGAINDGETPKEAVMREVDEETGYDGEYKLAFLWTYEDEEEGFQYHNYLAVVDSEFLPKHSWENDMGKWVEWGEWPHPMHWGLKALLDNAGEKIHRVITLIKRKKAGIVEGMTAPPAIVQHVAKNATANYNITNTYIAATTLWGEARENGRQGMQAVMNVIMNRANGDFSKAKDIVLAHNQFSVWNNVTNAEQTAFTAASQYRNDEEWQRAIRIVDLAARGHLPDITGGATHYFNPKKPEKTWVETEIKKVGKKVGIKMLAPDWAHSMNCTIVIKKHIFLKLAPIVKSHASHKPSSPPPIIKKKKIKKGKAHGAIREMTDAQDSNEIVPVKKGIVGDGIWEYELKSSHSYLRYRYEPDTKIFYLDNIGTPKPEDKNKGYAKALLETFFRLIAKQNGALDSGPFTVSGTAYIKHVVKRFAQKYNINLVQGRDEVNEAVQRASSNITESKLDFSVEGKNIPPEEVKKAIQLLYRFFKERDTMVWLMSHKWFLVSAKTDRTWIDGERYEFDYIPVKGKEVTRKPFDGLDYTRKMKMFRTPKDAIDYMTANEKKHEGHYAFRGMNMAEWVDAQKQGYIKSKAEYNLGGVLQTYYGSNWSTAHSYAGGFAPFDKEPTRSLPGVIIAVPFESTKDAKATTGMGTHGDGERVAEKIPLDQVKGVWYIVPTEVGRGSIELVLKDGNLDRGSACPPSAKFVIVPKEGISRELNEAYGDQGDHVIFGGVFYPDRVVANIVKSHDNYFGHTHEHGPTRWVYYQGMKTVFWHQYPPAIPEWEVIVKDWLEKHGYEVERQTDKEQYYKMMSWFQKKGLLKEMEDAAVILGALNKDGSNMQPVRSANQLDNHPPHMKVTDVRWRYYPELQQLDWQGKPTPEEHEGTKEFLAQRGLIVRRVHYLAGMPKR